MKGAKFIGKDVCPVRLGDRAILPSEVISTPNELVDYLLSRGDFIACDLVRELKITRSADGED